MPRRVGVLIVEDSPVVQRLLAHAVGADPRLEVVGTAKDADEAMALIFAAHPDVVSMDIRLPGENGLELTRRIMREHPLPIVVVASNVDDSALNISMNALKAGALAVVEKPASLSRDDWREVARRLCTQLYIMSQVSVVRQRGEPPEPPRAAPPSCIPVEGFDLLGLAASTGGPGALSRLLGTLPADFPLPIVVVQHMGASFMEGFASWLGTISNLPVEMARVGAPLTPGRVMVAPGDVHLVVANGVVRLMDGPMEQGQRPSADVLFRSIAASHGPRGIGVLLTGMGEDGARGLLALRQSGAHTIAEAASTAVIWGMPGAAVRMDAAAEVLPLGGMAPRLVELAAIRADRRAGP